MISLCLYAAVEARLPISAYRRVQGITLVMIESNEQEARLKQLLKIARLRRVSFATK